MRNFSLPLTGAGLLHGALMAANQGDDLFDLRCVGGFFFILGIGGIAAPGLGNEVEMQRERRTASVLFPAPAGSGEGNAAAVVSREDLREGLVEPLDQPRRGAEVGREGDEVEEQRLVVGISRPSR
jgi:hypothetical protein